MKHILLTNDDGFDAIGLKVLIEALSPIAKITVVAPARNKSACGHSLTLEKPLRMIGGDKFSAYLGQGEFCAIYIKRILEQGVVSDLKTNLDVSFSLYARGYE